jgi:hypothetical protein
MKFGEKYELLESLTTGGVETFIANDKVRGERVLVHILEGEAQKPNQPTVQWVLEAFRRIAPEPAGLVLETGRYSGTLYAYLVTRMPDEAALQGWVQMYRAQARETQEIAAPAGQATPESEFPTADLTSKESSRVPGSMTQFLKEFDPQAKPGDPNIPSSEVSKQMAQPSQPGPNVKPAADRSAIQPAPGWNAVAPNISAPAKADPNIESPASSFSSALTPRNFPAETNAAANKPSPKLGEFTNFFQGPFRVEGPAETPVAAPQQTEPPRKAVGEFTAMFNSPRPEEPLPAAGLAGNEPPGAGFTGWFSNPNVVSRTSGPAVAPPSGLQRSVADDLSAFPPPSKEPTGPPEPASYVAPAPVIASVPSPPIFPTPTFPNPAIEKSSGPPPPAFASDGATNAFNRRSSEPLPTPPALSAGPGAYTQIISVRPRVGAAAEQQQASANSPATPGFPSVPAIAPPPMPPAPAMPKIVVPPPPKAPKLDKVALPGPPPISYWPLILTLTVLFFIAVLLVLYFALKH